MIRQPPSECLKENLNTKLPVNIDSSGATSYLSMGASCCSCCSLRVWYSFSNFFSFFWLIWWETQGSKVILNYNKMLV